MVKFKLEIKDLDGDTLARLLNAMVIEDGTHILEKAVITATEES